jgi:dinuclear metal center YbgI/SA1388 family protein
MATSKRRRQAPSPAARAGHARRTAREPLGPTEFTVGALAGALQGLAPSHLAEPWDNVGLLLGDAQAPCARVLATIDFTADVLEEALDLRVDAVVAYHPPIFEPLKRLVSADPREGVLLHAAQAGVALLSPHTALDACRGGVNDWLAEGVAGSWREVERARGYEPLRPASALPNGESFKVVVFVPVAAEPAVRKAMSEAGAGVIGRYDQCSTRSPVTGTFRGLPGSQPAIGATGRAEEVAECRLEMVAGKERLPWAIAAMRAVHPYETPAFEVHALAARPSLDEGQGRLIALRTPATAKAIAARLRTHLGVRRIELAAPEGDEGRRHERIGLCAGAGFSLAADALARGATLFVTGEARHHDQLAAVARGASLLLAGHTNTERGFLPRMCERLASSLPGVSLTVSRCDRHPLREA